MPWKEVTMPSEKETAALTAEGKKRARFLVDESLGEGVVQVLRGSGWNVKGVWEQGLAGRDDTDVMASAWRDRRILLTHDDDFLDNRKFPEHRNPGVVVLPGADGEETILIRALGQIVSLIGAFPHIYRGAWMRIAQDGTFAVTARDKQTGKISTNRFKFPKHGPPLMEETEGHR